MPPQSTPQTPSPVNNGDPTVTDLKKLYESGKHRRYSLMFAINGGAFVVAQQMKPDAGRNFILGTLSLHELSWGLIVMTFFMGIDIFVFGIKMSRALSEYDSGIVGATKCWAIDGTFSPIGMVVLSAIVVLIIAGWFMAGFLSSR